MFGYYTFFYKEHTSVVHAQNISSSSCILSCMLIMISCCNDVLKSEYQNHGSGNHLLTLRQLMKFVSHMQ
jgi:hypothetical protein